jgi:hypothetical protein
MAIENMMKRGAGAMQPQEGETLVPQEAPPSMSSESLDDLLNRQFQEMRQQQLEEDPELADYDRRNNRQR